MTSGEGSAEGEVPPALIPPATRAGKRLVLLALKGAVLFGLALFALWMNLYGAERLGVEEAVQGWGYPGLYGMAALSGFNLIVPIPIVLFYPFFLEIGMHPVWTVLTIAAGMTTGDLVGFLLGSMGREVVKLPDGKILRTFRDLRRRRWVPYLILLAYAAFAPIPNELLVIPMAFLGFSLVGIFGATLVGNLIFNSLAALGITGLTGLFGGG